MKINYYLSQEHFLYTFVITGLDYFNILLYGMPDYIIKQLQRLLNAAAITITNLENISLIR